MTAPAPLRGGMSLYANLLDPKPDSSASISRSPIPSRQSEDAKEDAGRKPDPALLRFQPVRRPQPKQAKVPKPGFPKALPGAAPGGGGQASSAGTSAGAPHPQPQQSQTKSGLANWAPTEEDEYIYGTGEKRQRGGRRKKKKKHENQQMETDWDELYDPARPTNVEEYLRSDERIREIRDWKAVLYAHRRRSRRSYNSETDSNDGETGDQPMPAEFAPPASYSFVPPPQSPPREAPAPAPDDATGDDAYARRLALSGAAPPPPPTSPPPPPAPMDDGVSISRAPVRYEAPPSSLSDALDHPADDAMSIDSDVDKAHADATPQRDETDSSESRTNRPGQARFAERLMAKYGWTKGSGLGAEESGIKSALRVQVEKRRRRPDAEGGGFAQPGGRGRILEPGRGGGKGRDEADDGGSKFGRMSEVIVLRGMLENMPDLQAEMEDGLAQEIGEECGEKYGRVERLYIDIEGRQVFIKFTDQVSALRAVNALEGRIFNGNNVVPRFYDTEKFEQGIYT
ncbi:hypothetical protein VTK73DRAFT_6110 [Phialemonium thermophilum]|uniref:G-patch domain-containing protein n=1 Tax=Phialemonium thermophilum TaxID=223376 RepID=A0ABR3WKJ8_9PEZI